jgi:hypothetical protein
MKFPELVSTNVRLKSLLYHVCMRILSYEGCVQMGVAKIENSSIRRCIVSRVQEGKERPFIHWGQPQPLLCNQGLLMEKVNSKIAIQPRHLTFCLGICLDLLLRPSCLVQDVITNIQDVMAPSQRRHGPCRRALTNPLIGHMFCTRQNYPNPRAPVGS